MSSASSLLADISHSRPDGGHPSGSADNATDRSEEKKIAGSKRRKTFTGCWTCRQRHVKCDEQRPICKRCVTGNFACQGYSTRLRWLTPTNEREPKKLGRTRPLVEAGPSVGIDAPRGSSAPAFGASGKCLVPKRRRRVDPAGRPGVTRATDQACQDVQQAEVPGVDIIEHTEGINTMHNPVLVDGMLSDTTIPIYNNGAIDLEQDYQDCSLWPMIHGSSWSPRVGHLPFNWYTDSQQPSNNGSALPGPFGDLSIPRMGSPMKPFEVPSAAARERELISHWVTTLADKLVPFRNPANSFLTVVSPMVLEGSRIARTQSTCTVALFHAVCAISAAHQANLRGSPSEDGLINYHKQLSFQHLMNNMDRTNHDEQMACLATLCLWILIHYVTGTPGVWREVTKVTRDLLERISSETWSQSTTAALTYQSFSTSFALIQAQYLGGQERLGPLKTSLQGIQMIKTQILPARSLDLLSSLNAKLTRGSDLASEELDELEIEFALSTPEPSTDFDVGNVASALVHHHRSLFYYVSMLYFRGNSGRRGPEEDVQKLVARCLDEMEQIELLQKDANPKTWIYAVVAFEAATPGLRHRVRCLFSKRMSSGIATWNTLLIAVEEIWKRRDAASSVCPPEPWTRILSKIPELDVILY